MTLKVHVAADQLPIVKSDGAKKKQLAPSVIFARWCDVGGSVVPIAAWAPPFPTPLSNQTSAPGQAAVMADELSEVLW
jgi:hypothetical protein